MNSIRNLFRDKFVVKKSAKVVFVALVYFVYSVVIIYLFFGYLDVKSKSDKIATDYTQIKQTQENFNANFSEELFEEHLKLIQRQEIETKLTLLETELEKLKATEEGSLFVQVNSIYEKYGNLQAKLKRNDSVKIDSAGIKEKLEAFGDMLISKDFESLETAIDENILALDESYKKYIDSLPKPTVASNAGQGYSYLTVTTERGSTHGVYLVKVPLNSVRVKTIAAIEDDCSNNCPTKSMQQYVSENGAFAGITGSYACPADYASCEGKTWSFDYALYDSNDGKWFNKDALSWFDTGMITFRGNSYSFYRKT